MTQSQREYCREQLEVVLASPDPDGHNAALANLLSCLAQDAHDAQSNLDSAWQGTNGKEWARIARRLDRWIPSLAKF
jgi:hypothetical protein